MAAALLCGSAFAGDPKPGDVGYVDIAPTSRATLQGVAHYGSSPFTPPVADDATFVVDSGAGLDTGCTFRSGGPLSFNIAVDRAFTASEVATLKSKGLISANAVVRMPAYDIDFDGGGGVYAPERDRVYFNGHAVTPEFLTGGDSIWKLNSFQVPIDWVNFRDPAGSTPGRNEVRIDIDTANGYEVWCTAIDWASMSIRAARPVVMVHGIFSDNSAWAPVWVPGLDAAGVPVSQQVNPSMGWLDSIQNNAGKIAAAVEAARQRWGVDKVNLVTHSKGGLDSRQYVEGSDSVETLLQLGTPNAGSPLADFAQGVLLGTVGVGNSFVINALAGPAGIQLTTPYMWLYNRNHGYNPKVDYHAVAGVYDPQCTFCGNAILVGIVGSGDTIVPSWSVFALPYTKDFRFTSAGANHDATHTQLEKSQTIFDITSPLVSNASQQSIAVLDAPATIAHSETAMGSISAGEVQTGSVVIDHAPSTVSMLYPSGQLGLVLVSPSGRRIDPVAADADVDIDFAQDDIPGGKMAAYSLLDPEPGQWAVEVTGVSGTGVDYAVSAWIQDPRVTLEGGFARQSIASGEDLVLQATLREQGVPLLGASARAFVELPGGTSAGVALHDDGSNGDATANDGIYSGLRSMVTEPGLHRVVFIADGNDATGHRFSRETFGLATVSNGQAHVTSFDDAGVDTNGNGYYDQLVVHAHVHADNAGPYHVLAILGDSVGHTHQASVRQDLAAGDNTVALVFDGSELYHNRIDGPYVLSSLRLAQDNDIDLLPTQELTDAYTTGAYAYKAFEHERIQLTGSGQANGVDSNGNGLFDSMDVAVDVDLAQAGYYQWSAQLTDRTGTALGFFSGASYLEAGRNALYFNFDGEAVGKNGEDGPYYVTDLLAFGGGASLVAGQVFTAEPFLARQFEGYVRDNTPPVLQLSADPSQLWPPNHRMVPVKVNVDVKDDQDPQPVVTLVAVQSNEADDGLGDGDTANDIQDAAIGADDRDLSLRAERSGTGTGRVYTLTYQARDAAGNVATQSVTVSVPLSRR
jgi:triacylglycerol esterase/lipase EstA (alpha/beta hydrolase family)